jgi:hypothetical protein
MRIPNSKSVLAGLVASVVLSTAAALSPAISQSAVVAWRPAPPGGCGTNC